MILRSTYSSTLIFVLALTAGALSAKDKHSNPPAQDEIRVISHIPVPGDQIVRFLTTQHYRRNYLYAERESGKTVTLVDITNINQPTVIAELSDPAGSSDNFVAVTGRAALVSTANKESGGQPEPQTFRIMSFADPLHPTVQQEFKGVTATARDDNRGLIFLANADGIWILQQQFAPDPQAEKEWEHMMLDAR